MDNLVFTRIDDRLIHGQVVAAWLRHLQGVRSILVVDDATSKDAFMQEMFKLLVPNDISIEIADIDRAVQLFENGLEKPTMLIVKEPWTLKQMMDRGVNIPKINIGGMGMRSGRKKMFQNISASDEERRLFADFIKKGTAVEIQIIPASKTIDVGSLMK